MGIEAVGSAIGSVASTVGRGATSVGRISLSTIVNEGPVGLADLKNTMPLQIGQSNPVSELRFGRPARGAVVTEPLSAASVIAETETILVQTRTKPVAEQNPVFSVIPAKAGIHINNLWIPDQVGDDKRMGPAIITQVESIVVPVIVPNTLEFPKPQTKAENALGTQAGSQQQMESLVKLELEGQKAEERVVSERVIRNEQIEIVEEREVKRKKRFVVDKPVLARRLSQVGLAIQEAVPMAERLGYGKRIIGWILEKCLALAHPEDLSQVVRPDGPDGTLSIIRETIKAKNEFHSAEEVQAVVLANRPISIKEEGEPVSDEEVRKVFQNRMVKPANKAIEIMESRVVKKVQLSPGQSLGANTNPPLGWTELGWTEVGQGEAKQETNLEDLGLEEIFRG